MEDIDLRIILVNVRSFCPRVLCCLSCVSKTIKEYADESWSKAFFHKHRYVTENGQCRFCHQTSNTVYGTCKRCLQKMDLITATDAKKRWYLDEEDLRMLTTLSTYNKTYRTYMRLFDIREVEEKALVKYTSKGIYAKQHRSAISKAREKRITQITKLNLGISEGCLQWDLCLSDFLANGHGGIREVKKRTTRWKEFQEVLTEYKDELSEYYSESEIHNICVIYVKGHEETNIHALIQIYIDTQKRKRERTILLTEKLKQYGLEFRKDSKICKNYIDAERDDLNDVVLIMRQMDWLYKHTQYQGYMTRAVRRWQEEVRYLYGYLQQSEYEALLEMALPDLSEGAKIKAIQRYHNKREVPEFLREYL
jgi:hypothetical protein